MANLLPQPEPARLAEVTAKLLTDVVQLFETYDDKYTRAMAGAGKSMFAAADTLGPRQAVGLVELLLRLGWTPPPVPELAGHTSGVVDAWLEAGMAANRLALWQEWPELARALAALAGDLTTVQLRS